MARTLAQTGTLGYAPGQHGAAATSYLWAALLAVDFRLVHVEPSRWALALNALAALATGQLLYTLLRRVRAGLEWRVIAFGATLLACVSPNVLWFVHSGMEAMPFAALSLAAIAAATGERPRLVAAGVAAGALALLRPEAMPLGGLLAAYVFLRGEGGEGRKGAAPRKLVAAARVAAPWAASVLLYLGSNLAKTGHAMPSTLAGRRWLWLGLSGGDSRLDRALDFVDAWGTRLGTFTFDTSLPVMWVLVGVAAYGALRVVERAHARDDDGTENVARDGMRLAFGWALAHAAFYALLLPTPGHGGRYQPLTPLLFALALPLGAAFVGHEVGRLAVGRAIALSWTAWPAFGAFALLALPVATSLRDANALAVAHIEGTELEAGRFVDRLPEGSVASFDIGGIGWAAHRRIMDLGGLSEPEMAERLATGRLAGWLAEHDVRWVILPQSSETALPVFDDYRSRLHLAADPGVSLTAIRAFSTPLDKWQPAILATWNAAPSQIVYAVDYRPNAASAPRGGTPAPDGARREISDPAGLVAPRERHLAEHMLATLAASGLVADVELRADASPSGSGSSGCTVQVGWWLAAVRGCAAAGVGTNDDALRAEIDEALLRFVDVGDLGGGLAVVPPALARARRRVDPTFDPPLAPVRFPTAGGTAPPLSSASRSGLLLVLGALLAALALGLAADRRSLLARGAARLVALAPPRYRPLGGRVLVFFVGLGLVLRAFGGCSRTVRTDDVARAIHKGRGAARAALANDAKEKGRDPIHLRGPLFEATAMGDADLVTLLLDHGAPAGARDADGTQALHVAARFGRAGVAEILAHAMLDTDRPGVLDAPAGGRRRTALHDAVASGSVETVDALLRAGARADVADAFGQAPLHLLATGDPARASALATRLLGAGADPSRADVRGFTALHAAAMTDDVPLLRALAAASPDILTVRTPTGETALDVALRYGRDRAAETLLQEGAELEGDRRPPLHDAARMDAIDRVAALLALPADRDRLFRNRSALDVARESGSHRAEALLRADARTPPTEPTDREAAP